jgi:two-component system LytT family sensor kinase
MQKAPSRIKTILTHAFCWLLFIACEYGYAIYANGFAGSIINTLFFYCCNIWLFYVHFRLLNSTTREGQHRYLIAIMLIIAELLAFTLLKGCYEFYVFPGNVKANLPVFKKYILADFVRNIHFAGIATLAWASGNIARYQKRQADMEINRLLLARNNDILTTTLARAENAYLRHQIQPHMLLNALSFIYNDVQKHSREGSEVVLKLADIMRFTLGAETPDGKVAVLDEVEQVRNLVGINQSRFNHDLYIDLEFPTVSNSFRIIPLILITLTENMFKHGDFRKPGAYIRLSVSNGGMLCFETCNARKGTGDISHATSTGLNNTRLRLEHSYGDKFTLITSSDSGNFYLNLTIDLCK